MLAKIEQLLQEIEGLQAANAEELEALRIKYHDDKRLLAAVPPVCVMIPAIVLVRILAVPHA